MARTLSMTEKEFQEGAAYEASEKGEGCDYWMAVELEAIKKESEGKPEIQKRIEEEMGEIVKIEYHRASFLKEGMYNYFTKEQLDKFSEIHQQEGRKLQELGKDYHILTGEVHPSFDKAMDYGNIGTWELRELKLNRELGEQ